jgi:hypothetical protein
LNVVNDNPPSDMPLQDPLVPGPPDAPRGSKTRLLIVAVAVLVGAVAGYFGVQALTGGDGWTSAQKSSWMDECTSQGGSETLCSCILEKWEEDDKSFDDVREEGFDAGYSAGFECGQEGRT